MSALAGRRMSSMAFQARYRHARAPWPTADAISIQYFLLPCYLTFYSVRQYHLVMAHGDTGVLAK